MKKKDVYSLLNDVRMDFDEYEEYELSDLEMRRMKENINKEVTKKKLSWKKCAVIAACAATVAVLSTTAFASGFISGIIESFSTGHNSVAKIDPEWTPESVKDIYAEHGGVIAEYEENGRHVIELGDGVSIMSGTADGDNSDMEFHVSEGEIASYASFAPKLPAQLPDGYAFDNAYFIKSDDGSVSGDYLFVNYKNAEGKKIFIHERVMNDETGYEDGTTGEIREVDVNGYKALMYSDTIIWEQDGISVSISASGTGIDGDALTALARSVK